MSRPAIINTITSKAGRHLLHAQKHSPIILFGVGVVGVVTTVVLASKATLKLDEVLNEAENKKRQIEDAIETRSNDYTKDDAEKDGVFVKTQTALKIAKLYAPAFIVGTATIAAFTGQHVILSRRYVGISAAYAAVDQSFREYRKRVVNELGPEKDREFRAGSVHVEQAVDTDDGVAVKTVKTIPDNPNGYSGYARVFAQDTTRHWKPKHAMPNWNSMFVGQQQNYANELLKAKGHVSLNDVYDMLGFERTKAGYMVGWVKDNPNGDGYIDFGILDSFDGMQFVNGQTDSIWLDFNVDGIILDLI